MKIGDKSNAETIKSFGHIPMGKVILYHSVYSFISGGNTYFRMRN